MEALFVNEIKSNNHEHPSQMINKTEISNENIIIICFDPNNKLENFKNRLNDIHYPIIVHTEIEACISLIQSIEKQTIFFVASNFDMIENLLDTDIFDRVNCMFMFCPENDGYQYYLNEHLKIIGIYDKIDSLCLSIKEEIYLINKQFYKWIFFDHEKYLKKDLSKQVNDFILFQLFHHLIKYFPHDEKAKQQMIDSCRHCYQVDSKQLQLINEFEQNYQSNDAIHSFMKYSFLQQMINKALQTKDIDQLYFLRYFFADFIKNFTYQRQQITPSHNEKLIVYRKMELLNDELNQFQQNKGQLVSLKQYLIANTDRPSALTPSVSSVEQVDLISVLFEIECDGKKLDSNLFFADITQFTESSCGKVILFDFNTTFRLENVERNEQMWIIKLNVVNDGQTILRRYIDDTHRQIDNLSIPIMLGKLLCDMSQWNQSQIYFQHLLNDSPDEDVSWIEHCIGHALFWKGEWNEARRYYDGAYDRMMQTESPRIKDSAIVLSDIGEVLYLQGKYEESLEFHQRALEIRKKFYLSNHPHIATSLDNIGLIYCKKMKNDEALDFLKQALVIREEYYNDFHIDIAMNLNNIGYVLIYKGKLDEALDYCRRALLIHQKYYLSSDVHIAHILHYINYIVGQQEKHEEAINIARKTLNIQKKFYPSGHVDIVNSLSNIGNIKYNQEKYDESIQLHILVLTTLSKYYLDVHLDIVCTLKNIGLVYLNDKNNCEEAFHFYQQALEMLEMYYPLYYGHIANSLHCIGETLSKQGKYDEAIDFCQRALTFTEKYYPSYNRNIIRELTMIGHILFKQRKFVEAIDYYQRAETLLEEFDPTNYDGIIIVLSSIASISHVKQSFDCAIKYYEKCLRIQETSLSLDHLTLTNTLVSLGQVERNRHQYEFSLVYELKCFSIREKLLLSNHQDLGKTLSNIGECYDQLNHLKLALDYYKQALIIYEQCSPYSDEVVWDIKSKIEQLVGRIEDGNS